MGYRSPQIRTEADFIRFVERVFIALYLLGVLGLVVTWLIDGGPFWPTGITGIIVAFLFFSALFLNKPGMLRLFRKKRNEAEQKLKGLDIEHRRAR